MPFDYVFSLPPANMSPQPSAPGSTVAPAQGLDTSTGVGYYNAGAGWVPQAPGTVTSVKLTGKTAGIANTTLYAVPAHMGGQYQITVYEKVTHAASNNSTMPAVAINWTDSGDNVAQTNSAVTATSTGNATTTVAQGQIIVFASGGTNIVYNTNGYLSNNAAEMVYELQIRCTYLG